MRHSFLRFSLLATVSCAAVFSATHAAHAMPLSDALSAAYENNPTLKAERKKMEGAYEALPSAYSGFLPSLNASYNNGNSRGSANNGRDSKYHTKDYQVTLSQPIFRGGRTYNGLERAESIIKASTFGMKNSEQRVLLEATDAYLELAKAREIYRLNQNNENVLGEQLKATNERFDLGETTRTDVAQANSRLATATSRRITAHGDVIKAESNFRRLFQIEPPQTISIPEVLPLLPENLKILIDEALAQDPLLQLAYYNQKTSAEGLDVAKGVLLPSVNLNASTAARSGGGVGQLDSSDNDALILNVSVPLYQGGSEYSDIRRARKQSEEQAFRLDQERNNTLDRATSAWESLTTAKGAIKAQQIGVDAAKLALEGVKQEQEVGSRTVLDVLDAEQELFQANVNLVVAKRNQAFAAYSVLSAKGGLTAETLKLPVDLYDPQEQYDNVKYKFIGF